MSCNCIEKENGKRICKLECKDKDSKDDLVKVNMSDFMSDFMDGTNSMSGSNSGTGTDISELNDFRLEQTRICATSVQPTEMATLEYIIDNHQSQYHLDRLSAAFVTSKLWEPNSTIKIAFLSDGSNTPKTPMYYFKNKDNDDLIKFVDENPPVESFKKIIKERFEPIVNLKFEYIDKPEDADIRIDFDKNKGSWSLLGTDVNRKKDETLEQYLQRVPPNEATLNYGWIDAPTMMHEFCHVLGMFHEHQNPRGVSIPWNKDKVYKWAETTQGWDCCTTNTNILDHYELNQTNGSVYDPLSIMLYFFPGKLTLNNKGTRINTRLSGTDVLWINKIYGKGSQMTAKEYYPKVYGISLKESIEQSIKAGMERDPNSLENDILIKDEDITIEENFSTSSQVNPVFIVIFIMIVIFLVIFLLR